MIGILTSLCIVCRVKSLIVMNKIEIRAFVTKASRPIVLITIGQEARYKIGNQLLIKLKGFKNGSKNIIVKLGAKVIYFARLL